MKSFKLLSILCSIYVYSSIIISGEVIIEPNNIELGTEIDYNQKNQQVHFVQSVSSSGNGNDGEEFKESGIRLMDDTNTYIINISKAKETEEIINAGQSNNNRNNLKIFNKINGGVSNNNKNQKLLKSINKRDEKDKNDDEDGNIAVPENVVSTNIAEPTLYNSNNEEEIEIEAETNLNDENVLRYIILKGRHKCNKGLHSMNKKQ